MGKLLVICGPTATGKTELGMRLAKRFGGEIVSADSRQVYKGMDIGTGKDLPVNSKFQIPNSKSKELDLGYYLFEGIPIWMLDVVRPNQQFSVAQYVDLAWEVIADIWKRKKLPIIVGGTGFYIKGVTDGIETLGIPPNWQLRLRLSKLSVSQLFETLSRVDSGKAASMNVSDRKNPRRLIRAIEVARRREENRWWLPPKHEISETLFIGLRAPFKYLYQKIDKRIERWVKQGAQQEIKKLFKNYRWEISVLGETLGYKEWRPYFGGKASVSEVIKQWKYNEHHYARRQMTWFKKDRRVNWFDITQKGWENKVEKIVRSWYTERQDAKKN